MSYMYRAGCIWRLSLQPARLRTLPRRYLAQSTRQQDERSSTIPIVDPEQTPPPPPPKTPVQTKLWAFVIGGGAAMAYAAYKRSRAPQQAQQSSLDGFTKYTLVDKDDVSSTCSIFTIAPLTGQKAAISQKEHSRSILSIQIKQPELQIARSYTILPPISGQTDDTIRLLIRREAKGEVSGYLHDIAVGSDIEVRGPSVDLTFPSDTTNVIFLAGGTGVAPALKTAALLKDSANVHILWASRKREDSSGGISDMVNNNVVSNASHRLFAQAKALFGQAVEEDVSQEKNTLVMLFDLLKLQRGQEAAAQSLTVDYFVDENQTYIRPSTVSKLIMTLPSQDAVPSTNLIIVSGPDGFIYHWAGAKEWVNGRQEQGALGGVLSKLNLKGWQVIKL